MYKLVVFDTKVVFFIFTFAVSASEQKQHPPLPEPRLLSCLTLQGFLGVTDDTI